MSIGPYFELKRVEQLARVAEHIDPGENDPVTPKGWGPASMWRFGILVLGILIACLMVYRLVF